MMQRYKKFETNSNYFKLIQKYFYKVVNALILNEKNFDRECKNGRKTLKNGKKQTDKTER